MSKKILVVEDDNILQKAIKKALEKENFEVIQAFDGEEGLDLAQTIKPDFILLDIIIPKLNGFSVLKILKEDEETKNIPVVVLTNLGQAEDIEEGESLGAAGHLIKANLSPVDIVAIVKNKIDEINKS